MTTAVFTAGQVLQDRYQLQRKMGDRSGRQTWLALDRQAPDATRRVVIKFLAFDGTSQWRDLTLFEREVTVLQKLEHPRIPRVQAAFHIKTPAHWLGFVAAYIPGQSLQQALDQGQTFTEGEVKAMAVQVLKILHYLHGRQPPVLHRDLKPSNLIRNAQNQIFLVDFGAVQDQPRPTGQSFTVVGSYGYTPMEQFGGQAVPASDLYALGATLVHLLTGVAPADLVQPDLTLVFCDRISLTPAFQAWLTRMTAPVLAKRFQSAAQSLESLQGISPRSPKNPVPFDPQQSRIKLQKTDQHLNIKVPPLVDLTALPWLEAILMVGLLLGVMGVVTPIGIYLMWWGFQTPDFGRVSAGLLLLCLGLGLAVWGVALSKRHLMAVELDCRDTQICVKQQCLGLTYWQQQWPIAEIAEISLLTLQATEAKVLLHIQTGNQGDQPFAAIEQITPAEGQWLQTELQQWLRFSGAA